MKIFKIFLSIGFSFGVKENIMKKIALMVCMIIGCMVVTTGVVGYTHGFNSVTEIQSGGGGEYVNDVYIKMSVTNTCPSGNYYSMVNATAGAHVNGIRSLALAAYLAGKQFRCSGTVCSNGYLKVEQCEIKD